MICSLTVQSRATWKQHISEEIKYKSKWKCLLSQHTDHGLLKEDCMAGGGGAAPCGAVANMAAATNENELASTASCQSYKTFPYYTN